MVRELNIKAFSINVAVSLTIAALGYSIQFIWWEAEFNDFDVKVQYGFRALRMVFGYFVIPLLYIYHTDQSFSDLGFKYKSFKILLLSLVFGVGIYLLPSYIFVKYQIFTAQWSYYNLNTIIVAQILIGIMASITDLWTRGFVLLQIEQSHGKVPAIVIQNILWFSIHIYEILILENYIGLVNAILLTLFLGITGDLLAIHTHNITGLMLGHIILNIFIVLAGVGLI